MIPFGTKSVTLSMLIDLLTIVHVDRRRWRSHQLTSDLKRCLLFRKCLRWSSRKAVSVPTSVVGGLGASQRPAILSGVCHRGHYMALSRRRLVGSCVRLGKNFFPAYDHVCTLDTVTGNLEVNSVFITIRSMRDTNKFRIFLNFFRNSFLYIIITVSFTMAIKLSPAVENLQEAGGQLRNPSV